MMCLFIKSPKQNKKTIEYIKLIYFLKTATQSLLLYPNTQIFYIYIVLIYSNTKKQSNFFIIIFEKIFLYPPHT